MKMNIQPAVWPSVKIPVWASKTFFVGIVMLFLSLRGLCSDGVTPVSRGAYAIPSREAIAHMTAEQKEARITEIKARANEIKAMDKSQLTKADRKALRAELRSMKKEARAVTGVYISVGALIIIILLLILIL